MGERFQPGQYEFDEQKDLAADRAAFEYLVNKAKSTDIYEEKIAKRELIKELIAHGLVDRQYILKLLQDHGTSQEKIDEWQEKILTTSGILNELVPLPDKSEGLAETKEPRKPKTKIEGVEIEVNKMPEIIQVSEMILPTDDEPRIISGEGESLEHKMIPRTAMLINLLSEFGISLDDCKIFVGTNKPEVVRQENYRMFTIKPREKIIYVCDEEGNSTYILHNYTEDDSDLKRLMALKKSELKAMGELVDKIDWSNKDTWQEEIFKALTKKSPVPDGIKNWQEYIRKIRDEAVARKKEKEKFVDLETLKAKVRAAGIDSKPTYKKEQKNHPSWPSNPNRTYGEEWVSWPDLWGKKYVDLETLKAEVRAAGINSQPKYRIEQKNRPSWPSGPEYHYGEEWVSWPDLWGKKFVDLETLKAEVKAAGVDSEPKYRIEQKNHPSWPSSPRVHYGEEWVSWTDLWGK